MAVPDCKTGLQPSRIPGNIGTLNSRVMVWEHDPFWARATQIYSYPFTKATGEHLKESISEAEFRVGAAFLKASYKHHDMFVCTINPNLAKEQDSGVVGPPDPSVTTKALGVDFVGAEESGVGLFAQPKMPGGDIYECDGVQQSVTLPLDCSRIDPTTGKSMFVHQVWRHEGSLFTHLVPIHPSEYGSKELSELQNRDVLEEGDLQSAPRWDYIEVIDNGKAAIWPIMSTKHSPGSTKTTHWTLQKWTSIWQGQDFFITVRLGNKKTNDAVDPEDGVSIDTEVEPYKYLMYETPSNPPAGYVSGISNQAFDVVPKKDKQGNPRPGAETEAKRAAREAFDWRYKTYILVEVGVHDVDHRYFIEIVKGRRPRFLHLGDEWDNPTRLEQGVNAIPNDQQAGFKFMRKCRELSSYNGLISDELFRKDDFRFTVRNHLGRIVITFEGYENNPWVITRLDNDPTSTNFDKKLIPMVIPSAPVRIHGGNISCAINYTPLAYLPTATIKFVNRQVDVKEAENEDIYLTFSHMGQSIKYHKPSVKARFFNDDRFAYNKVGYDCDAYRVIEKLQNSSTTIDIYEEFDEQYRLYGKGWLLETPRTEQDWITQTDPDTLLPLSPVAKNGMTDSGGNGSKGTPSKLEIINSRDPVLPFPLSLDEQADSSYPYTDFAAKWDVGIVLSAGSIVINPPSGPEALPVPNDGIRAARFENSVTPIATSWRLIVLGGGKPFGFKFPGDKWSKSSSNVTSFDISELVLNINDSWSSEDFYSLQHEMQMECYIPIESTSSDDPLDTSSEQSNLFALGRKMIALHNKAFYLTVSYWWDDGIGHRGVIGNVLNVPGSDPNGNDLLIQMTGVAYGAQLQRSNNRLVMKFTIKDYMSILENQFIFNSPFFDGVQDVQSVYELAKMAGFDDSPGKPLGVDRRPLAYLRKVLDDGDLIGERKFIFNGEESRSERYDLPGSFATLIEPSVKFQNGETYESAMKRIAQLSSKALYFDRWGVLRLETLPSISAAFSSANEDIKFKPVFDFVSTPFSRESNIPGSGQGSEADFSFDPTIHAAHLVYNVLSYQRSVEDCVNQIVLLTASNEIKLSDGSTTGGFIVEGYTFFEQIWDPESEGFLGFRKPFYQSNGVFGGLEGIRNGIAQYAKMKFPPVIMSFETYGVPGLKALDIITLDGNLAYITELTHELDAESNRWWMNITAEWLKPFKGELGFLEATEPTTTRGDE